MKEIPASATISAQECRHARLGHSATFYRIMALYETEPQIKPTDLRGILKYVPQWNGHIFVVALDGGVVEDDNFHNLLLDLAVLRSLGIKLLLVGGIGHQLIRLAREKDTDVSDIRGEGPIDDRTHRLSIEASGIVVHQLLQGLSANNLKCAVTNAVRAIPFGLLGGTDQLWRGKVDRIETSVLSHLIDAEIIPIVPAMAHSRDGRSYRINSDLLASEIAVAMKASKVIYLHAYPGLTINGHYIVNIPVSELKKILEAHPASIEERVRSKAWHAVRAVESGIPRVHIMDGRVSDALLTEIFSKVGVGTMVYGNDYAQIRPAKRRDVPSIVNLTRQAVKAEALRHRTRQALENDIDHFYVYEIDESIIGCIALLPLDEPATGEIASLYVQPIYQHRRIGRRLVEFALREAEGKGWRKIFALTTQSHGFFRALCGFEDADRLDLPAERREILDKSGRNSRILFKRLP